MAKLNSGSVSGLLESILAEHTREKQESLSCLCVCVQSVVSPSAMSTHTVHSSNNKVGANKKTREERGWGVKKHKRAGIFDSFSARPLPCLTKRDISIYSIIR